MRLETLIPLLLILTFVLSGCSEPSDTYNIYEGDNVENNYYGDDDSAEDILPTDDDDSATVETCEYDLVISETSGQTFCSGTMETADNLDDLENGDLFQTIVGNDAWISYFYGNARYTMPHGSVFESWYGNEACPTCESMKVAESALTASIMLAGNMTMKPGSYIIVLGSDSTLFAIDECRTLRPVTPNVAEEIYGDDWNNLIRLIPDWAFADYQIGDHIASSYDFDLSEFYDILPEDEFLCVPEEMPALMISTAGGLSDMSITSNTTLETMTIEFIATGGDVVIQNPAFIMNGLFPAAPGAFSNVRLNNQTNGGYMEAVSSAYGGLLGPIEYRFDPIMVSNGTTVEFTLQITVPENTTMEPGDYFSSSFNPTYSMLTDLNGSPIPETNIVVLYDLTGSTFTIVDSLPGYPLLTLSLAAGSPGGMAVPSWMSVLRFIACADTSYDVVFPSLKFDITMTDNAATDWSSCSNLGQVDKFALVNTSQPTTPIETYEWFTSTGNVDCGSATWSELGYVYTETNDVIPAGTCSTYELWMDTVGASSVNDDSLQVSITDEEWLVWFDQNGGGHDGSDAVGLPVLGGTLQF